jgi:hypothetical protein
MPTPGDVFYLPPEEREGRDKRDRPHLLLSVVSVHAETVTLAYGSTRNTDALHGAEHVFVNPGGMHRGTGLVQPTYIYPSRLVSYPAEALPSRSGRIADELPAIRASLARAIGLGTGVTSGPNLPGFNRRGRVVALAPELAADWDLKYAAVVTEPRYSCSGYQQTVVPILDEACEIRELDVVLTDDPFYGQLGSEYRTTILAVPMIATIYAPEHITGFFDLLVPESAMRQLDGSLVRHFGL